ncbi:recombinase family protein [Sandaracinobacter sp.]|uniref:recombinase family protein n=1 Tax=Sandaracinobacter sp. TaxID=2487581 RepID=UPI0035AEB790
MAERPQTGAGTQLRSAIYTRKSTEEGLEQDFNSLDAQREACAAYILSQRHEGWTPAAASYDDGGFSGGSMERPGLKMLLADIAAGKIDVVVVYKVDRLTRSLADFAKIVEVLDARGASFVSVTQSFNTTTSMGRLTLNVLLSFAQFEREVTGERIRDKIAASKAKGMWMGGVVPLGYRVEERKLIIDPVEADLVRHMFQRYLELGSGRELATVLARQGIVGRVRVNQHGRTTGGAPMTRGAIYSILKNRIYVGEIAFRDQIYPGQHEAVIERELFDRVQTQIEQGRVDRMFQTNADEPSLLSSLVWDCHGRRMSPSHGGRRTKRYRYYVSQTDDPQTASQPVFRISANDLEGRVFEQLCSAIDRVVSAAIHDAELSADQIEVLQAERDDMFVVLAAPASVEARRQVRRLVQRIEVRPDALAISLQPEPLHASLATADAIVVEVAIGSVRVGKQLKLVISPSGADNSCRKDPALIKLVVQALTLRQQIPDISASTFDELASGLGYSREHAADLLRISTLAPDILTRILEGTQPEKLTRTTLMKASRVPLDWGLQRQALGFG